MNFFSRLKSYIVGPEEERETRVFTRPLRLGFGMIAVGGGVMFLFKNPPVPGMISLGITIAFIGLGLVIYEGIRD